MAILKKTNIFIDNEFLSNSIRGLLRDLKSILPFASILLQHRIKTELFHIQLLLPPLPTKVSFIRFDPMQCKDQKLPGDNHERKDSNIS